MVLVWLGRLLAVALISLGALKIGLGVYVARAFIDPTAYEAATRRYIGSGTTGEAIDRVLTVIVLGVALGLLAKVAANRRTRDHD